MFWRFPSQRLGRATGGSGSFIRRRAGIVDSLRHFGQVFPVVVTERYELIDGFKRVRALRHLGVERVRAMVLDLGVHALKAAILDLNRRRGAISDLEEGMVVHSLCREDGLSQVEVAVLVGRHKSWVCRRLSLIERLCDEALEHIRLGLIHKSIGRELSRLPALKHVLPHSSLSSVSDGVEKYFIAKKTRQGTRLLIA